MNPSVPLSIGTSMRDYGGSTEFRSLHVGFWGSRSRLEWHSTARDSLGQVEGAV
jgi:hypothetical protein